MAAAAKKDEHIINAEPTHSAYAARAAAIDAQARNQAALATNGFFADPAHLSKLSKAEAVIRDFFPNIEEFYVNHRENRGKPFTTIKIKITPGKFPNASAKRKKAQYTDPLDALGVERVNSVLTNSLLFRVR